MRNISFDNPYLLLALIPLLACILVPVFIAIRKENKSKSVVASLIIHIILVVCITLALGDMIYTAVMTQTQVYVLADVSYSANRNLDQVDDYIREIEKNLPRNAQMSVIAFARNHTVITELGEEFSTVQDHGFKPNDVAATDITTVLNHTVSLFDENVVKRIVLITDGKQTRSNATGELVAAVENAYANNIYIDAIYLDNNLTEDVREIQISDVEYAPAVYKNQQTMASILIQSTYDTDKANIDFYVDSARSQTMSVSLNKGYNVVTFPLPTTTAGRYDYRFTISAEADTATANNVYDFTQSVTENMQVLLVTWDEADVEKLQNAYPEGTIIDSYVRQSTVPCTVEELCKYDEIVLSNFDVRNVDNFTAFIDAIDKVVSRFGKSLVTMGDLRIQNKDEAIFKQFEDMLPVKFGNSDQDPKLYALVIDTSRSMQNFSRLRIAKQAAVHLLDTLSDDDYVMVVNFWGDVNVLQGPTKAVNREQIAQLIQDIDPKQGTGIGIALETAGDLMIDMDFADKQIMLISDGMTWSMESDTPAEIAQKLRDNDITTSVIHPAGDPYEISEVPNGRPDILMAIAKAGGGEYFPIKREEDLVDIMYRDILDELTESVILGQVAVDVAIAKDAVLEGIDSIPDIFGYAYAKSKASATTVLTVDYVKKSGNVIKAPLFAYWSYGNGRVSTFTSTYSGEWTQDWDGEQMQRFFANVMTGGIPEERMDTPYIVNVRFDGAYSQVEIQPVTLNPKATAQVTVTSPDGSQVTEQLVFDSTRYFYSFETPRIGRYLISIVYTNEGKVFESESVFNISYSPEYNLFEVFDPSDLHGAIRNRGTVCEGSIPGLEPDEKEVSTYTVRFVAPLMIFCAVLYVVDVIIRKLKLSDVKSFFGIKSRKGGAG